MRTFQFAIAWLVFLGLEIPATGQTTQRLSGPLPLTIGSKVAVSKPGTKVKVIADGAAELEGKTFADAAPLRWLKVHGLIDRGCPISS
jgi:hypothetical protein